MRPSADNESWQRRRAACAVVIVTAIVLAAPAIDAALDATGVAQGEGSAATGMNAAALLGDGDADAVLSNLEHLADSEAAAADLPAAFVDDIGLPPGARDIRASGSVVGYVIDADVQEALDALDSHMESRGWTGVSLGQVDGATYMKPHGECTWALVTCTRVGSAVSIVIRFR